MSYINAVYLDGEKLIDLSFDTVSSTNDIVKGKIGHLNTGEVVTGTFEGGGGGTLIADMLETKSDLFYLDLSGENISSIRASGFYNNPKLRGVTLPTTVTEIGDQAFRGCTVLLDLNLDELSNLTKIGQYIIHSTNVTNVVLPAGITTISQYAFSGASNLRTIDMSACGHITAFGGYVAYNLTNLTTIIFGDNTASLGANTCQNCSKLTTVHLPERLQEIPTYCFAGCTTLASITLPPDITKIGTYAFQTAGLTNVTIPQYVTNIATAAFYSNSKLTEVHFKGTPTTIATNAFGNCKALLDIYVPWSSGQVAGAPWGATNAQIYYNYVEED